MFGSALINISLEGFGLVVAVLFTLFVLFAVGYVVHLFYVHVEKSGNRRRARQTHTGFIVNGEFHSPEDLIERACMTDDDFKEKLLEHDALEAAKFMQAGGASIKRQA